MSENALRIISDSMESIGLNYAFMEWIGAPEDFYWIGEYQESEPMFEDGMQESTFILTGFARGITALADLESAKQKIKEHFHPIGGKKVIADDGSAVAIFYASGFHIRMDDGEVKKIQVNLDVKEWSVK